MPQHSKLGSSNSRLLFESVQTFLKEDFLLSKLHCVPVFAATFFPKNVDDKHNSLVLSANLGIILKLVITNYIQVIFFQGSQCILCLFCEKRTDFIPDRKLY